MAVAKTYGRIDAFHPENEAIEAYLERVELYFTANDTVAAKKVPILLTTIREKHYTLLRDFFAPAKPADKSYAEISEALTQHYRPPRIVIAERFHFHRRSQVEGESIAEYVATLRKLASTYEFGDSRQACLWPEKWAYSAEAAYRDELVVPTGCRSCYGHGGC